MKTWEVNLLQENGVKEKLEFADYEELAPKAFHLNHQYYNVLKEKIEQEEHYYAADALISIKDPEGKSCETSPFLVLIGIYEEKNVITSVLLASTAEGKLAIMGYAPQEIIGSFNSPDLFIKSECIKFVEKPEDFMTVQACRGIDPERNTID